MTLDDALKLCGLVAAVIGLVVMVGIIVACFWILWLFIKAIKAGGNALESAGGDFDQAKKKVENHLKGLGKDHRDTCTCGHQRGQHALSGISKWDHKHAGTTCTGFTLHESWVDK